MTSAVPKKSRTRGPGDGMLISELHGREETRRITSLPTRGGERCQATLCDRALDMPLVFAVLAVAPMSEVTRILSAIEQGDSSASEQLLPLVYQELRQFLGTKARAGEAGPNTPGDGLGA